MSGVPVFDADGRFTGYRGIGRFITEKKLADQALRASEARFRSLTELSSDWYWEQDKELRFTYFSKDTNSRSGYSQHKALGNRRWELPSMRPLSATW